VFYQRDSGLTTMMKPIRRSRNAATFARATAVSSGGDDATCVAARRRRLRFLRTQEDGAGFVSFVRRDTEPNRGSEIRSWEPSHVRDLTRLQYKCGAALGRGISTRPQSRTVGTRRFCGRVAQIFFPQAYVLFSPLIYHRIARMLYIILDEYRWAKHMQGP
jgi:hypothetical protein